MAYLIDTNILLRWLQPGDAQHGLAVAAVDALFDAEEAVYVTAQNLIEFWNVATRPQERNGLGLTPAQADLQVQQLEAVFPLLLDTPDIYPAWRGLVVAHNVSGIQVHDTRLVAVMQAHGVSQLLTFNGRDFARFDGIQVVHPAEVPLGGPSTPLPSSASSEENEPESTQAE